jgi:serine/threonine protein kinase
MLMEYCPHGDLYELVKKSGKLSQSLAKALFLQILNGVEYLHKEVGLAHLDLKLENVLIDDDFRLKLCDFGFIEDINIRVLTNKGTDGYKAPEIYNYSNEGFAGDKADFFALGVLLFIMVFGVPPFTMATKENPYYRLFYRGPNSLKYFFRMHPTTKALYNNGELDQDLMEILVALMDENPTNRPNSINEIREFAFLKRESDLMSEDELKTMLRHQLLKINNLSNQTS